MRILFFSKNTKGFGEQLQNAIENLFLPEGIETYRNIQALSQRLREPFIRGQVLVLFASHREDLVEILSLGDLLSDLPVILILPDKDKDTVKKGHGLCPRLLTYGDSSMREVVPVLQKMLMIKDHEKLPSAATWETRRDSGPDRRSPTQGVRATDERKVRKGGVQNHAVTNTHLVGG